MADFFRTFLREPRRVGAVAPSSRALSDQVVRTAGVEPGHRLLELGGGTGSITSAIFRANPAADLISLEPVDEFADHLRTRFPRASVVQALADSSLKTRVVDHGWPQVDRVLSGLPWTVWSEDIQDDILRGVADALTPDGRFVTYTYLTGWMLPGHRRFLDIMNRRFHHTWRTQIVWKNLPPAFVVVGDRPRKEAA